MKTPILLTLLTFLGNLLPAMEPTPGFVSTNHNFALHNGTTFTDTNLDAYDGKVVVIMMMTPWCPFCQGNAIAVGDGILDHYNHPDRGVLRGKTDQGVEIVSLLLSTEPASTYDTQNKNFATAHGYQQWGLDASSARLNPRVLLGYYRGGFIDSSNLYNWGNDRRRVTILNLVKNSPSHPHRSILFNQNSFDSSENTQARAAINAVLPAPTVVTPPSVTFSQWSSAEALSLEDSDPLADPDKDGVPNLLEFYHGTPASSPGRNGVGLTLSGGSSGFTLGYQRATGVTGITSVILFSDDLTNWQTLALPDPAITTVGSLQQVTHTLPVSSSPKLYYRLRITLP